MSSREQPGAAPNGRTSPWLPCAQSRREATACQAVEAVVGAMANALTQRGWRPRVPHESWVKWTARENTAGPD